MIVLRCICIQVGWMLSLFFSERVKKTIKRVRDFLYSKVVMHWFLRTGNRIRICSPLYLSGGKYISIGNNFSILSRARIEAIDCYNEKRFNPKITIGDNVVINSDFHIGAIGNIEIEDNVVIASRVYISDHTHGKLDRNDIYINVADRYLYSKGPVCIGKNVWIGEGCCILPNVRIGENTVIGANSVVTKDIPSNVIAAGVPCRVIRNI